MISQFQETPPLLLAFHQSPPTPSGMCGKDIHLCLRFLPFLFPLCRAGYNLISVLCDAISRLGSGVNVLLCCALRVSDGLTEQHAPPAPHPLLDPASPVPSFLLNIWCVAHRGTQPACPLSLVSLDFLMPMGDIRLEKRLIRNESSPDPNRIQERVGGWGCMLLCQAIADSKCAAQQDFNLSFGGV